MRKQLQSACNFSIKFICMFFNFLKPYITPSFFYKRKVTSFSANISFSWQVFSIKTFFKWIIEKESLQNRITIKDICEELTSLKLRKLEKSGKFYKKKNNRLRKRRCRGQCLFSFLLLKNKIKFKIYFNV